MLSEAAKAVFVQAAEARKQRGIKLGRVAFMADSSQVDMFNGIYNEWVDRFGKEDALDFLLSWMNEANARLREWDDARRADKKRTRIRREEQHSSFRRQRETGRQRLEAPK